MNNYIRAASFLPSTAVLELTYLCNHKCLFCSCPWEYEDCGYKKEPELNIDEWKSCIDKLVECGVSSFSYTGGEPLLKKDFREIIKHVSKQKAIYINEKLETVEVTPQQFLISNGQMINDEILDFIKKYDVNLSMSLPGLKTYNEHTGSGECEKVLNLFKKAKERQINTTVNITVTKKNLHELHETISNALIAGADTLLLNRFLPGGRGMFHTKELLLNKEETVQMLIIAENVLRKSNRYGNVGTELPFCLIKDLKFTNLTVGTRCAAATGFFVVGPEGKIRTCNHSPVQLFSFTNIENLKKDKYWQSFTQKNYLPENCNNCKLTNMCDGGCREAAHLHNGSIFGDDPVLSDR